MGVKCLKIVTAVGYVDFIIIMEKLRVLCRIASPVLPHPVLRIVLRWPQASVAASTASSDPEPGDDSKGGGRLLRMGKSPSEGSLEEIPCRSARVLGPAWKSRNRLRDRAGFGQG